VVGCRRRWAPGARGDTPVQPTSYAILVVPDTLLQAELGPSFLDRGSFRVRGAANHEEALRIAEAWAPDLIIVGSSLPFCSATTFCLRVRRDVSPAIKLLLVTEEIGVPEEDAQEVEPDAHLVSPVDQEHLLHTVAALLNVSARRAPRVAVHVLARVGGLTEDDGPQSVLTNILSLSESGVLLESPRELRLDVVGTIIFVLPDVGHQLALALRPRVLMDEVRLHYGAEFVDASAPDRERIRDYVATRIRQAAGGEE
jgi:CheY-like chemotaxis protein